MLYKLIIGEYIEFNKYSMRGEVIIACMHVYIAGLMIWDIQENT